jgi:hypothetical protein
MSLIPAFEIGIWNAWILMLPLILLTAILAPVKKGLSEEFNALSLTGDIKDMDMINLR